MGVGIVALQPFSMKRLEFELSVCALSAGIEFSLLIFFSLLVS